MTTAMIAEIDVEAPIAEVYRQWTRVETFPEYLEAVRSVRRIDDVRSRWSVSIGGVVEEFYADVVDQVAEEHISWQSTDGVLHDGRVDFEPTEDGTHVRLRMAWESDGAGGRMDSAQAEHDLARFKELIEARASSVGGAPTRHDPR
ncbi:SRPBCC family protein [Microbacterium betulae]|uniref:SRPBCC family protein n=1 Tax=Microbacterium betulae TaxID=2981139 RepID=A0AA97FJ27_9MICO|nr:SRPBCC family protein [Microbacterium sp. AB]WOF22462.1 SRPBCC family protein [Microbacterium sp. AB]